MSLQVPFTGTSRTITQENNQISGSLMNRVLGRSSTSSRIVLEDVIDVNKDLELFRNHQVEIMKPKVLYKEGFVDRCLNRTSLFRLYREEKVLVTNEAINLDIISQESIQDLIESKKTMAHLGLVVIGIKGLTRKNLGTKTFLTVFDDRFSDDLPRAVIAAMEVDMSNNRGLFYCSPDILLEMKDLKAIKVGIQTRGYEKFKGHSNLLMTIAALGKGTYGGTTLFKLNIDQIIEAMSSKGIIMIKPDPIPPELLGGLDWDLNKNIRSTETLVPREQKMYINADGTYSMRFSDYKAINADDTSEIESHFED